MPTAANTGEEWPKQTKRHPSPEDDGIRCLAAVKDTDPPRQCRASRVRDYPLPLCSGHARLGVTGNPEVYGRHGHRVKAEQAARRRRDEEQRRQGIAAALRVRVNEHRETMIDALMAPVLDPDVPAPQRQKAALEVWARAFGRPGTSDHVPEGSEVAELSIEDVARVWASGMGSRGDADEVVRGEP